MWFGSSRGFHSPIPTGAAKRQTVAAVYNIGSHHPVELGSFIEVLEHKLGKKAKRNLLPLQDGDAPATYADVEDLARDIGFRPTTSIEVGVGRFVDWYREYYGM